MFVYNFKLNGSRLAKIIFITVLIVVLIIFSIAIYKIFSKSKNKNTEIITVDDAVKSSEIFEITPQNYTDILQTVTNNVDNYVGLKVHFSGYVYRLIDFDSNQFVLARDMIVSNDKTQTLVVGFLCSYDKAQEFEDGTWVELTGEITKQEYHGELAVLNILDMKQIIKPDDQYVYPPTDTYIPTSNMF